jgi:serine phosphatase RsbU (regulator of sigma subunit)
MNRYLTTNINPSIQLFRNKQKNGIVFGLYCRIAFAISYMVVSLFTIQKKEEMFIVVGITMIFLPILAFTILKSKKTKNINKYTFVLFLADSLLLLTLSSLAYSAAGSYENTPSVFLLKDQYPVTTLMMIIFSAFSLNHFYPIALAGIFDIMWCIFIFIVFNDVRTNFTLDNAEHALSSSLNKSTIYSFFVTINGLAIAISLFIYKLRGSIFEAVDAEIENLKLQILNRDLEEAFEIQKSTILINEHIDKRVENFYFYKPYEKIGGDFLTNKKEASNRIDYIFGDVSGHGIASAMISGMSVLSFLNLSTFHLNTNEILQRMNDNLETFKFDHNISMVSFSIDFDVDKLKYSYAGHHEGYILRDQELIHLEGRGTLLLSPLPKYFYSYEQDLQSGDWIMFFSDGLFEVFSDQNILLNFDTLLCYIKSILPIKEPNKFISNLVDFIFQYSSNKHEDDITILLVNYKK